MGLGIHLNEDMGLMIFSDTPVCTRHREGRFRSTRDINLIINSVGKKTQRQSKSKNKTKQKEIMSTKCLLNIAVRNKKHKAK